MMEGRPPYLYRLDQRKLNLLHANNELRKHAWQAYAPWIEKLQDLYRSLWRMMHAQDMRAGTYVYNQWHRSDGYTIYILCASPGSLQGTTNFITVMGKRIILLFQSNCRCGITPLHDKIALFPPNSLISDTSAHHYYISNFG